MKTFSLFNANHVIISIATLCMTLAVFLILPTRAQAEQLSQPIQIGSKVYPMMMGNVKETPENRELLTRIHKLLEEVVRLKTEINKKNENRSLPSAETRGYSFENTKDSQVRLSGYVNPKGYKDAVVWFEWAENEGLLKDNSPSGQRGFTQKVSVNKAQVYEAIATTPGGAFYSGQEYYYRMGVENAQARVYGEVKSFEGLSTPTITSVYPSEVILGESTEVTLQGYNFHQSINVALYGPGADTSPDSVTVSQDGTEISFGFPNHITAPGIYTIGLLDFGVPEYDSVQITAHE